MKHHYHRIHPRMRGARLPHAAGLPVGTLSPAQILTAYGFRQGMYAGLSPVKLGIGSLGGGVVQADIDNAVRAWGMAAPHVTVLTVGGAQNDPVSDQDSNVENMLDLVPTMAFTWWWLTGTPADITIGFGPNAEGAMTAVTQALVDAGCEVASWSWGSAASDWPPAERAALAATFARGVARGVTFCAASGDNSVDDGTSAPTPDYPASDPNVWGVGGTRLLLTTTGARASERAWGDGRPGDEGGGGGFDPGLALPSFQTGVVQGTRRGVPDTSANADPESGWQMSANGGWTAVGGTSASSPFTAALLAVAKGVAKKTGAAPLGLETPLAYASRASACNDILLGSNGDPTTPGWDPATGLGSPSGPAFIAALGVASAAPPAPAPTPSPIQTTLAQVESLVDSALGHTKTLIFRADAARLVKAAIAARWIGP